METTKIPLSQCIESKHQNRKDLGDVSGLARSIEVNGQITPLIVVADGETYQLVAGHRRTAAMRKLGLAEADAYVMDGWDDARIAQVLNAENNHRKELTEGERGQGVQTMLALGVPVADAAVSADIDEEKAEAYVRGSKLVPVDAVNLDFDAVALIGEYDDVQTEDDVVAVFSKKNYWERMEVFMKRAAILDSYLDHVLEFVRTAFPKFPSKGHASLRQWAHEIFEARYECVPDDAWAGFREPRGKALDQFVLIALEWDSCSSIIRIRAIEGVVTVLKSGHYLHCVLCESNGHHLTIASKCRVWVTLLYDILHFIKKIRLPIPFMTVHAFLHITRQIKDDVQVTYA